MVDQSRRNFLKTAATAVGAGIAGCSGPDSSDGGTATPSTSTDTATPTDILTIKDVRQPDKLPRIWKDSLDPNDYHANAKIGLSNPSELTADINGEEINSYGKLEPGNHGLSFQPRRLQPGENTLKLTAEHDTETATVTKQVPELKKLDIVPGVNQELREQIQEHLGEEAEKYLKQHSVPEDHTVFTSYQTPEQFNYADYSVDLAALEWWHDNEIWSNIGNDFESEQEMHQFLESINLEDSLFPEVENKEYENARSPDFGVSYPNSTNPENPGTFNFDKFSNSSTAQEALDWLQPYLFNWEDQYTTDVISTEDEKFAAVLQEALDQYTELDTHVWAFDLPEHARSTHGNGLIWDETSDELLVMETITSPTTVYTKDDGKTAAQHHVPIEDSLYLPPEMREELGGNSMKTGRPHAYKRWWHPLRFAEDLKNGEIAPRNGNVDFRTGKIFAGGALRGMSTGGLDNDISRIGFTDAGIASTTEYVSDRIDKLVNYNSNDFSFDQLKQESKIMNHLWEEHDGNAVMYLDGNDNFSVAEGVSNQLLEDIWNDKEGKYDDIDSYLENT